MKKIIGISLVLAAVVFFSCQDEKVDPVTDDAVLSEKAAQITLNEVSMENALTEMEYEIDFYSNAVGPLFMQQRMGQLWRWSNKLRYRINQCPNVGIESEGEAFPKTITLDYGDGTELQNGKILSGVITIEITAPRNSPEYQRNVTYSNFSVDGVVINGTSVITVDRDEETFRTFVNELEITLEDGTVVSRKSERSWQWIEGMDTQLDQTDDVIQITGYAEATTAEGDKYLKEIVEPLTRNRDCRFIVQGVVTIKLNGELISTLDYGDGTCDAVATLTNSEGEVTEVDLALRQMGKGNRNGNQNGNGMAMGDDSGNQYGNQNGSQQRNGQQGGNTSGSRDGSGNQNGNGGNGNRGGGMNG